MNIPAFNELKKLRDAEIERRGLQQPQHACKVEKVDGELGIVFGFAIVSKVNGKDYVDTQGDIVPEDSMLKASADFMRGDRMAKDMHSGGKVGQVVFAFPLTTEIAKALKVETEKTGLIVGMKPSSDELLAKYKSGEYTGFSIGGKRVRDVQN